MSFHLATGVFNVSSFIQFSIIQNFEWVQKYEDKKIIQVAIGTSCLHLLSNFVDHILVIIFEHKGPHGDFQGSLVNFWASRGYF